MVLSGPIRPRWSSPARRLAAAALLAALLGVGAFLLLPVYSNFTVGAETGSVGPSEVRARHATDINGIRILFIGLVPVAVAADLVAVPWRHLRSTVTVSAILLSLFAIIGGATMGLFIVPAAILEWLSFGLSFRRTR